MTASMTENLAYLKLPPHSIEAEQSLIGSFLLKPSLIRTTEIDIDDFYKSDHRVIYGALVALDERRSAIDFLTLAEHLETVGELENIGGMKYLSDIQEKTPSASNAYTYAQIIRDRAALRRGISVGQTIADAGFQGDTKAMTEAMADCLIQIAGGSTKNQWDNKSSMEFTLNRIDRVHNGLEPAGIKYGIQHLDKVYPSGMKPGDLIVMGGRPSMGKTAVVLNIAEAQSVPVGIISLEMEHDQLMQRRLAMASGVSYTKIDTANMNDDEWRRFVVAVAELQPKNIHVCDRGGLSITEVYREATRMKYQHGIELLAIDYLQLISAKGNNRTEEIGDISRKCKALGKRLGIPIILLSQLNRNVENRPSDKRRPIMADLRESGQIEQDADMIIFLYRDSVYNDVDDNQIEFIVQKARNGPPGICYSGWDSELMKLRPQERNYG